MSAIITNQFRHLAADLFYEKIFTMNIANSGTNDIKNMYFFIGKPKPWELPYNDNNPPAPTASLNNEYQSYMDLLALKKLDVGENLTFVVPRYDWVSGTVYFMYDDQDMDLYNHPSTNDLTAASAYLSGHPLDPYTPGSYYVVTDEWEVYMCVFSGFGSYGTDGLAAKSTVKPTGGSTAGTNRYIVETSDGYRWKYLYTLSQNDIDKYVTESWIPVKYLTSNDSSYQWLVQSLSNNVGAIDTIKLTTTGSKVAWYGDSVNYGIGAAILSSTINTVNLDPVIVTSLLSPTFTNITDLFTGSRLTCVFSDATVESHDILSYVVSGGTSTVTLDSNWVHATPASGGVDKIYISPKVSVIGNVSLLSNICTAKALVDVSTGKIKDIRVINPGIGYRLATVTVAGKNETLFGTLTDVTAHAIIPAGNGLGENPKTDLGAWNVMLTTNFTNTEGAGDFPVTNDYRRMGLVRDVYNYNTTVYASALTLRGCYTMDVNNVDIPTTLGFVPDETIQQLTGPVVVTSAYVIEYDVQRDIDGNPIPDPLHVGKYLGTLKFYQDTTTGFVPFTVGQVITGVMSGTSAGITAVTAPEYQPYSGSVLYIEQRRPIVRAPEQQESIRVIVTF